MTFIRSMCSNLDKRDVLKEFRKRYLVFLEDLETTECPSVTVLRNWYSKKCKVSAFSRYRSGCSKSNRSEFLNDQGCLSVVVSIRAW